MPRLRSGVAGLLAFAAACLGSARARPDSDLIFSHRSHLARAGTGCADCHAPVVASARSDDRNLPAEKTCLVCHDGTRAPNGCAVCHASPATARPVELARRTYRFNHGLHLGFGDAGPVLASAIERGRYFASAGDLKSRLGTGNACLACHRGIPDTDLATAAHLPRMADCLVCHTRIDPPFSCGGCHTPDAELRPASHTARFADAHSNRREVPDKSGCRLCHGERFTCIGCH